MNDCRAKRIKSRKEDKLERNENRKNAVDLVQGKQEIISFGIFIDFFLTFLIIGKIFDTFLNLGIVTFARKIPKLINHLFEKKVFLSLFSNKKLKIFRKKIKYYFILTN